MTPEQLSDSLNHIDDDIIIGTDAVRRTKREPGKPNFRRLAWAACFILISISGLAFFQNFNAQPSSDGTANPEEGYKSESEGVAAGNASSGKASYTEATVSTADTIPESLQTQQESISVSEEEVFTSYNTTIFKGTITELENIVIDFNGMEEYRCIAQIQIEKIYRGDYLKDSTVSVLLPCPITGTVWMEDCDTVSAMKIGMAGIFMVNPYDSHSYMEMNGARIYWNAIADCGFYDGNHFLFLETSQGLRFSRDTYESISDAATLDQIETYVMDMLEKISE